MRLIIFNMRSFLKLSTIVCAVTLSISLATNSLFAASPTPTPTTSPTNKLEQQINSLKDRIASRVAQLKLVDKRGLMGKVTDVTDTQLTLSDYQGNIRIVDVDELTKFSSPDVKGSFGISDIKKGTTLGVIGLYNKESRHLLARWVDVATMPLVLNGAILSLDKSNYTFKIVVSGNNQWNVDVETITKTNAYTKAAGIVRSGFSKLEEGQRVLVVGVVDKNDATKIIASRITVFPELPHNPALALVKQEDIAPVTSTGSGKKLTPLTK